MVIYIKSLGVHGWMGKGGVGGGVCRNMEGKRKGRKKKEKRKKEGNKKNEKQDSNGISLSKPIGEWLAFSALM